MNLLQITDLSFGYAHTNVLDTVSMTITPAEFISIIGPNGAGKSTLLKLIDGIYFANHGEVLLNGVPIESISRKTIASQVAYLPQEIELSFAYSVEEIVRMGRYPHMPAIQLYTDSDLQMVQEVMNLLDVAQFRQRVFQELSGGEKQRVLIASALAQEPKIL
jgi:iron complex transport system ATP-binding protein